MSEPQKELPQIYLLTPTAFEPEDFAPKLAAVLDAHEVACVRLALASKDEYVLGKAADLPRGVPHA